MLLHTQVIILDRLISMILFISIILAVNKIIILYRVACSSGSNGCFGFPSNCVELQNCDMLVKYTFDAKDKKYNFELIKR